MTLSNLQERFFKGRVITYKNDGNTAVEKQAVIQKIHGRLHRGKTLEGNYCRLYLYYEELGVGIDCGSLFYPDETTVEEAVSKCSANLIDGSPQDLIALFDKRAEAGGYVRNAEIAFARYVAPEKVDGYVADRAAYLERAEKRRNVARARQEAEEKAFCAERNEEAQQKIQNAIQTIRSGGVLENDSVTFYKDSRYEEHTYCIVNHLARLYGVKIPLKVQGWINQRLIDLTIADGVVVRYRYKASLSHTFPKYMDQLISAVIQENANRAIAS